MVANEQGADARWEGGDNKKLAIPPGGPHLLVVRGSYEKKDITTETQKVQGAPADTSEVPLADPEEPSRPRMDSFGRKQNASRFLMLNEDPQLPCPSIFRNFTLSFDGNWSILGGKTENHQHVIHQHVELESARLRDPSQASAKQFVN